MTLQELKVDLKKMIVEGLRLENDPNAIGDADPIFIEGLGLDSIDALELVVLVEERYHVVIPDEDVGKEVFASIDALSNYVMANRPA